MNLKDEVAIVGIGQTEFSRGSGRTELDLACEAISAAIEDAGLDVGEIDGLTKYEMDGTLEISLVSALGIPNLRYFGQVGYGGSGQSSVVQMAAMGVATGQCDVAVCYRAMNGRSGLRLGLSRAGERAVGAFAYTDPFGMVSMAQRLGMFARRHMIEYGSTEEQFGHAAVTLRDHAQHNPKAIMYGRPITLEDHQESRMIADPLRLLDCCLESDGAVALVLTRADRAKTLRRKPVYIMSTAQATGPHADGIVFRPSLAVAESPLAARDLYARAGVGPGDVDVAMLYDHFTPFILIGLESFGFCGPGEAGPFVEEGNIRWPHGPLPVNTHGGSHSEAYVHGLTHVAEAVRQLRGTSTAQVDDAEIALVGSSVNQVSSALILRR
ncbi:MAG: lipid-transfer protein [Actinobacteria bacterium]|nr:lipid-transfer protein [Actinomycetota bacterium]